MNKLEAIRKIVDADDVIDSSKLAGIKQVLDSEEKLAESIAETFSTPRAEYHRRLRGKRK